MDTRTKERLCLLLVCEPEDIPAAAKQDVLTFMEALARIGVGTPTDRELALLLMILGHIKTAPVEAPEAAPAKLKKAS